MKRYRCETTLEWTDDRFKMNRNFNASSIMVEQESGEWVRFEDYEKMRKELEHQIPSLRIEKLEKALGLVSEGRCPECGRLTRDYETPSGSFAPEACATLREQGANPATGHKVGCSLDRRG